MPDPNQRATYLIHVRDGFHRRAHLPSDSREALNAYRDGFDQVEQMEYYHSQMKKKQNEKQQSASSPGILSQGITRSNTLRTVADVSASDDTSNKAIAQWLLQHLPHLNQEDVTTYSKQLIDDGFDSVAFIEEELLVEDVSFMKKAHRRVIERQLRDRSGRDDSEK